MEDTRFSVLAIDDDFILLERLRIMAEKIDYPHIDMYVAETVKAAFVTLTTKAIDLVLCDYRLPDGNGLDVMRDIKALNPTIAVVIMTAHEDVKDAIRILQAGGDDYLVKPIAAASLEHLFVRIFEKSLVEHENGLLDPFIEPDLGDVPFIHASDRMREVLNSVARSRNSSATVLISGESGTGKELIARLIHSSGSRHDKNFVTVNIAALPETLMESELFGHIKGAFTGADQNREGRFGESDGGSIFIDEVGDIPLSIQVKLLRAIQFGQIQRVGENTTRTLDVRIIAATNRDLKKLMDQGKFRSDLYWRLNVIPIEIPPLRERKEDIAALSTWFIEKFAKKYQRPVRAVSREALAVLMSHSFPGNVRELENLIERAVLMSRRDVLSVQDIRLQDSTDSTPTCVDNGGSYDERVGRFELDIITTALAVARGNQSEAARTLGIGERRLRSRLKILQEKAGGAHSAS